MAKVSLSDLTNLSNAATVVSTINANNNAVEVAMEKTLSRDGTSPNHMQADLDMNSNRILNLPDATSAQEPVTLSQLDALEAGAVITADYITLSATPELAYERVLTGGSGVSVVDSGPGGAVTLSVDYNEFNSEPGTFTNKTIDLTDNTITGTTAEFNAALSDNDFATLAGTETLTNKTFTAPVITSPTLTVRDNAFTIQDEADNTKQMQFQLSGITTGLTRTITVPNDNGTLVFSSSPQTLSSKTMALGSNTISGTTAQFNTALTDNDFATLAGTETFTNKTLTSPTITTPTLTVRDNVFTLQDETDNTKQVQFQLSGISTGTTRTLTLPNGNTELTGASITQTLTNKSISLGSNTITGTTAQFNTALSDNDFATLAGTETLTNKTIALGSNTVSGTTAQFNTALSDNDFATLAGAETFTNKTLTAPTITVRDNAFTIQDNTDNTKQAVFEAGSITTGTTRTLTVPDANGTLVLLNGTQTLTNKTVNLSSNTLTGTTAQFNTALSDGDFATLAGTETLSNKTLTSLNTATITGLTNKATPDASNDYVMIYDNAGTAIKKATVGSVGAAGASGVSSFNSRIGAVVPVAGDYTVALGGTGTTNLVGFMQGLQPYKAATVTNIGVNPGTWANAAGTLMFTTPTAMECNMLTSTPNWVSTPAVGAYTSGSLSAAGTTTDGAECMLYLCHRASDNKVALFSSSADVFGASSTFTMTAAAPGVITFPSAHGLRRGSVIMVSNSGGSLPAPLGSGIMYFVTTTPTTTTCTIATSMAAAIAGSHLTTTTTGTGTHTATWGIQPELDLLYGTNVVIADRCYQKFCWVWNVGRYGGASGIPDFNVPPMSTRCILTGSGDSAAYRFLTSGVSSGTWTAINLQNTNTGLAPQNILHNSNRVVRLMFSTFGSGAAGQAWIRARSSGAGGFRVGEVQSGETDSGIIEVQTDSTGHIEYFTLNGTTQLSLWVIGWECSAEL